MQRELIGWNCLAELNSILDSLGVSSVLLIRGDQSFEKSGAAEAISPTLESRIIFLDPIPEGNPSVDHLESVLGMIDHEFDAILAIGGGSVMDMAKLIKAFCDCGQTRVSCEIYERGCEPRAVPLIAVPTTAGSGSQVTPFAVLYDRESKYSVAHEALLPDVCLVDPALLGSLPEAVAAASGLDALCQAIESWWCIQSTEASRRFAKEALQGCVRSLIPFVETRAGVHAEAMARASHLAGKAIALTKTTAPHAVSYPLTWKYGVPHGHAVGVLMQAFLAFTEAVTQNDCQDPRGVAFVRCQLNEIFACLGEADGAAAGSWLKRCLRSIGLEDRLTPLGIASDEDIDYVVAHGFNPQRVHQHPRRVIEPELRALLRALC